ncbi:hypothetical protein DRO66_11855 [Candidatus Bathyarchaeota archaeon]|nr:MAG: hypothetical protein DRO66_11855 [Candidatus Bathyarchaeota archaeon]
MEKLKKNLWIMKAISKQSLSTQKEIISRLLNSKKKYVKGGGKADVDNILKCTLCPNMCRFACPVSVAGKSEMYSPSGRATIAYLYEREWYMDKDSIDLIYACGSCSGCEQWCPFGFSVEDLLIGVREELVDKNRVPTYLMRTRDNLVKNHTLYQDGVKSLETRTSKGETLFFSGCTTLNKTQNIAHATLKILDKAEVEYDTLDEEWCCGAPLSILGFMEDFKKFMKHNKQILNDYKTLICSCPTCAYTFKEVYRQHGYPINIEVLHTSEYYLRLVKEGKIKFKQSNMEIVYHDPCVLARKMNCIQEPRELMNNIPGLTIKEPQNKGNKTWCCGKGGMLGITNPYLSKEITSKRVTELKAESNTIISACPICKLTLQEDQDIEVMDISEILAKHIA